MSRLATRLLSLTAACSLTVGCVSVGGGFAFDAEHVDESNPLVLRAGARPSDGVDEYVARHGAPVDLSAELRSDIAQMTPEDFVQRLCGDVRGGYLRVFFELNSHAERDQPLGESAASMVVPSCLYSTRLENQDLRTLAGGAMPDRSTLIGDPAAPSFGALATRPLGTSRYYADWFGGQARLLVLGLGEQFRTEPVSAPVTIRPQDGSNAAFLRGLEAELAQRGEVELVTSRPSATIETAGETTSGDFSCTTSKPFDFSAATLEAVYGFARERAEARRGGPAIGDAELYIVDNGFFGALNQLRPADAWKNSPFPAALFRPNQANVVADRFNGTSPLNYSHGLQPGRITSHGTFVTGLALGGPTLADAIPELFLDGPTPRLQVTVLNAGKGSETVDASTQESLSQILIPARRRVLNMSYRFSTLDDLSPMFDRLINSGPLNQNLFVVAAGNDGRDISPLRGNVEQVYPASLGGVGADNIITVAALNGNFQLADFSNYGDTVDIAAPGCGLTSWIDNSGATLELSGTSAAAPLVSYAAVLLSTLSNDLSPQALKRRLIGSGDLMAPDPRDRQTASNVRLNILLSLLAFDDVIELRPGAQEAGAEAPEDNPAPQVREFIGGDLLRVSGLSCANRVGIANVTNLLAFKSSDEGGTIFWKPRNYAPCAARANDTAHVVFQELFRIRIDDNVTFERIAASNPREYPLSSLAQVVTNTRPSSWGSGP